MSQDNDFLDTGIKPMDENKIRIPLLDVLPSEQTNSFHITDLASFQSPEAWLV